MRTDKGTQILLALKYRDLVRTGAPLPDFRDVGFRNFSQFDEDGILLYIFAVIGAVNRKCVELCIEDGVQCNTTNLVIEHGWEALMVDGSADNIAKAAKFFGRHPDTCAMQPKLVAAWIDRDNVDELIRAHGFEGEIDLLSLDIDGVDWWVWQRIQSIRPRVVVLEYNNGWGPDDCLTVPYRADFRWGTPRSFFGASLAAFCKLGAQKGYRLVGCNKVCNNAFFVRKDLGAGLLPTVTVESCLRYTSADLYSIRALPQRTDGWEEI